MTYDWEGNRTRRARLMRLASAVAVALAVPLIIAMWQGYLA